MSATHCRYLMSFIKILTDVPHADTSSIKMRCNFNRWSILSSPSHLRIVSVWFGHKVEEKARKNIRWCKNALGLEQEEDSDRFRSVLRWSKLMPIKHPELQRLKVPQQIQKNARWTGWPHNSRHYTSHCRFADISKAQKLKIGTCILMRLSILPQGSSLYFDPFTR